MKKITGKSGWLAAGPFVVGTVGILLLLGIWQWGSTQVTTEGALPAVPKVLAAVGELLIESSFWAQVLQTLGIALSGWAIAGIIGVTLGILTSTSKYFYAATRVLFEFLRPVPAIVILPLAIMVLGPTLEMGIFLVVFGVTLTIAAQTAAGVEAVDPVMLNTARSYGMGATEILLRVVLPGAAPYVGTAMRVAAPVSLVMCIVAGMLGGAPGLGSSLTVAQFAGRTTDIFAYVIVLGILGLLVQSGTTLIERKVLHWHSAYRKES